MLYAAVMKVEGKSVVHRTNNYKTERGLELGVTKAKEYLGVGPYFVERYKGGKRTTSVED